MQNQYINQPICYEEDEIDLRELFETIWRYKYFIAIFTTIVTALAIVYVLSKPNEYKIYTKLSPLESKGANLGGLGALASMAGISVEGGGSLTPDEAYKSVLEDYEFMKSFIIKHNIDKKILSNELEKDYVFAFDSDYFYKLFQSSKKTEKITIFDIYKNLKDSYSIDKDKKTGLITIAFTHPSRQFAYEMLNLFLQDATNYLIKIDLENLDTQIAKYKKELATTNNLKLKAELAKLISNLIKQKVYINSGKYYKSKVITPPYIPDKKDKVKPKRGLIVIVAFVTSLILAIFLVFFIEFIRGESNDNSREKV